MGSKYIKHIAGLSWDQETAESVPVGTLMATLLPQWLTANDVPESHPPRWRMDRVFRAHWTDEAKTEGRLEFIPRAERTIGHRIHASLEDNTRIG
ncbi:hypothetical protein BGX29_005410, partial [Mortierella sp. GBA35]